MSKVRTWICPCCRACVARRRKGETAYGRCRTCGVPLRPGRTLSWARRCRHVRGRAQYAAWQDRYETRPRTASGRVFCPTRELRYLWRSVRKARRADAILRRGTLWLAAVSAYVHDNYRRADGTVSAEVQRWTRTLRLRPDGTVELVRHAGGWVGPPKLRASVLLGSGTLGEFRRNFQEGQVIEIACRRRSPTEIRETLIHETLHYCDSVANIGVGGHGHRWTARLDRFRALFPVEMFGTKPPAPGERPTAYI